MSKESLGSVAFGPAPWPPSGLAQECCPLCRRYLTPGPRGKACRHCAAPLCRATLEAAARRAEAAAAEYPPHARHVGRMIARAIRGMGR